MIQAELTRRLMESLDGLEEQNEQALKNIVNIDINGKKDLLRLVELQVKYKTTKQVITQIYNEVFENE